MNPEDLPDEIKIKIADFFLKSAIPQVIVIKSADDNVSVAPATKSRERRKVLGVKELVEYLASINYPYSKSTIYRLVRTKQIPFHRPTPQLIIFNLDEIDEWLETDCNQNNHEGGDTF
jgi:excisionase family DNA binding protein